MEEIVEEAGEEEDADPSGRKLVGSAPPSVIIASVCFPREGSYFHFLRGIDSSQRSWQS